MICHLLLFSWKLFFAWQYKASNKKVVSIFLPAISEITLHFQDDLNEIREASEFHLPFVSAIPGPGWQ
jgi:hypothetical protein